MICITIIKNYYYKKNPDRLLNYVYWYNSGSTGEKLYRQKAEN